MVMVTGFDGFKVSSFRKCDLGPVKQPIPAACQFVVAMRIAVACNRIWKALNQVSRREFSKASSDVVRVIERSLERFADVAKL